MPEATITPTTPTPIARRVARPRAGSVTDRRQARIGVEPPATQDPDKGARAADTTASAVLAGVAETAIALAIGQKPDTTAQRRARAQQRASQAIVPIDPNAEPVMMELIGLTSDGRLVQFWDKEYPVRRVNMFLYHP